MKEVMSKVETAISPDEILKEAQSRRTFAIISHPDAGKTTLTEKLLLYGGAIHEAGSIRQRKAHVTPHPTGCRLKKSVEFQ